MRKDVLLWAGRMGAALVIALLVNQWMNNSALALSVVETTMYFSVLFFAYRYGAGTGAVVGTACGVISTLQAEAMAPLAMFCLGGTFGGLFRRLGRLGSSLGFLCGAAGAGFLYGPEELSAAGPALLIATGFLFVLPEGLLYQVWNDPEERERPTVHAGYEGVTVKKVQDIAESFEKLAQTFPDCKEREALISDSEGAEIFERCAAEVCGCCKICAFSAMASEDNRYYLHYLLHLFEKKGVLEQADMPRLFGELCRRKEDCLVSLNEELGRARQSAAWKTRFYESREAVSAQFSEMSRLLSDLTEELTEAEDVTDRVGGTFRRLLGDSHLRVRQMLVLEHGNGQQEAFLTVSAGGHRSVPVREAAERLTRGTGRRWQPADTAKAVVGREPCTLQLLEEPAYRMLHGVARARKDGEEVSGDTFSCIALPKGKVLLCLSDGCGSGPRACEESEAVTDMAEQLLETGIAPVSAAKLINSVLLLKNEDQTPTTLDLAVVDLYRGACQFVKLGAAATFLLRGREVILIAGEQPPMGMFREIDDCTLTCELQEESLIVMMTDGVLDAFSGEDKEQAAAQFLQTYEGSNPKELAELLLQKALGREAKAKDDMTVLVAGFWKK